MAAGRGKRAFRKQKGMEAYRDDPLVSSSRPKERVRPKTKQTESSNKKSREAKNKRAGGESPAPRARANKDQLAMSGQEEEDRAAGTASHQQDSVEELLEDSQE